MRPIVTEPNMTTPDIRLPSTIGPLVARHAEDAAFYWSQLDNASNATQIGVEKYAHFNRLLDAHLEGLSVAGAEGLRHSLSALDRWKGAAETFTAAWLASALDDADSMKRVLEHVRVRPDAQLRGLVSALVWQQSTSARQWVTRLAAPGNDAPDQVAALRAAALMGDDGIATLPVSLRELMESQNSFVRAAACRVATSPNSADILMRALHDTDINVRAEACIAIACFSQSERVAPILSQCVTAQANLGQQATGWHQKQSMRRLLRWVRHLAAITPLGNSDIAGLLNSLPPRVGLSFVLHHGDCAHLSWVIDCMERPELARYAGWVWQSLTGVNISDQGMIISDLHHADDENLDGIVEAPSDSDHGLPIPDVSAIRTFRIPADLPLGERCLLGQPLTPHHAVEILETAPQALRVIAAQMLGMASPDLRPSIRGPAAFQQRQISVLRARLAA